MIVNSQTLTVQILRELNYSILINSPDESEHSLGGAIRDSSMLEFLVDEINGYSDPFEKAATALQKIALRHPFWQGNKRTAFLVADILLMVSGYEIIIDGEKLNHDIRELICSEWSIKKVREWIIKNSSKIIFNS